MLDLYFAAGFANVEFVSESTSDALNDIWGCAVEIVVYLVWTFGSLNMC